RPRPSVCLAILNYLLCEIYVTLSAARLRIVEEDRLPEARCLRQAHIARDNRIQHLRTVKVAQIFGHRRREIRSLVIHGQQESLNGKIGVQFPAESRERIEKLGNTLK